MTWRDDLRRVSVGGRQLIGASFRGVAFFVDSSERAGGRRAVVHEFPLRDDPFVEDLGRKARTFRIDGYVLGDDYISQRDALLAALEDDGSAGELVHPYHGVRSVVCLSVSVRESRAEGGIATFSIELVEAPTQSLAPTQVDDAPAQVSASADSAVTATSAELGEQYDASGLPPFAVASSKTALTRAAEGLGAAIALAVRARDAIQDGTASGAQELAALTGAVALLTAEASSLARQPGLVIDRFRSLITGLVETTAAAPGAVMGALLDAYGLDFGDAVTPSTTTRARELLNQAALIAALRRVLVLEAARLAPIVPYPSIEEALAARDRIADALDEQADGADDTAYPALVDLRSQVFRAVPGATAFASIVTADQREPVPTLVIAHGLYGSVDKEADIIARNGIAHPGFATGTLKVLSDA